MPNRRKNTFNKHSFMSKNQIIFGLIAVLFMVSCGTTPEASKQLRPVKIASVEALGLIDKSFSGVVMPDQYSNLAFKVGGPLVKMNVEEGQMVRKGQIVAEIDPIDYRLKYEATRSSFLTAKSQLERAEKLLAKDAISRQDYESTRANFDNAKAAYESAESLLEETKLKAPFTGFIQNKFVENYQKVQPGTSIVCLIDPQMLKLRFTMPESNLDYFLSNPEMLVEFENHKGVYFKTRLKEYVPASTDGSGVPVYLYIDDARFNLKDYTVAVGFTCRIILRHSTPGLKGACVVPISSIIAVDGSDAPHLYVYDEKTSKVALRKVKQEGVTGRGDVIISEGLNAGEKIVIAGSTRLTDGQQVKVLSE